MSLAIPEAQIFVEQVNAAVDFCMEHEMKDAAVSAIQRSVMEHVYEEYPMPRVYERKYDNGGLLDPANMVSSYDKTLKTLTVEDIRPDWEPTRQSHAGRNVSVVVETGKGYDFKSFGPRPFHEPAEKELGDGLADQILELCLDRDLGGWSM